MLAEISKGIKPAVLQKKEKKNPNPTEKANKTHQNQKIQFIQLRL